MTILPPNWDEAVLGEVCQVISGATPNTGVAANWGGEVRWVTPNDLSKDRSQVVYGGERSLTRAGYESCSARRFPAGSVIVSSRAPVGYVAIAGEEMCTSQGCKTAVPPEFIDSRYLYWYLLAAKADLEARASGTTFKEISSTRFAETALRWPAHDEQRRIVELLEDHLSRLDAADRGLSLSLTKLKGLREQTLIHGLTAADVSDRVDAALADVGTADGDLPSLPVEWSWARLGDVAHVVGGVTKDAKKQGDPSFVEVPYLRVANVQRGHLNLDSVTRIRVDAAKARALRLEDGDVLLNEGGDRDKLARGWVWEGQIGDCIHQNHVFRARLHEARLDPYLLSWTANTFGGRWAERNGKQSVNLASISLSMIRKMPVIVPAPGGAERVVASLRDMLDSYDRLASALESARRRGAAFRRSLLASAFSGRLTGSTSALSVEEMIGA